MRLLAAELGKRIIGQDEVDPRSLRRAGGAGPRADDRRARPGENAARAQPGGNSRSDLPAHPVHARPDAERHHRHGDPGGNAARGKRAVPFRAGADFRQPAARGRNQPHAAEDAGGAAGGHAGTARHRRRPARYDLPAPFFVLATQNPIEQEGTYPLPEAQLDRFMFNLRVDYPSHAEEVRILLETTRGRGRDPARKSGPARKCSRCSKCVRQVPVAQSVAEYAVSLVQIDPPRRRAGRRISSSATCSGARARARRNISRWRARLSRCWTGASTSRGKTSSAREAGAAPSPHHQLPRGSG